MKVHARWRSLPLGVDWLAWAAGGAGRIAVSVGYQTVVWGEIMRRGVSGIVWKGGFEDQHRYGGCGTLSPDGRWLAMADSGPRGRESVYVWVADLKAPSPPPRRVLELPYLDPPLSLCFSPDGTHLLLGTLNGTVRVVDLATEEEAMRIGPTSDPAEGHVKRVWAVSYHPLGELVLSGSKDGSASLWEERTGKETARFLPGSGQVTAVAFAHHGSTVITGGSDVVLWDASSRRELVRFPLGGHRTTTLLASTDSRWLVAGTNDGRVAVWDLEQGRECGRFELDPSVISHRQVLGAVFLRSRHVAVLFESGDVLRLRIRGAG